MNLRQSHENLLVSCRLKSAKLVWWWPHYLKGQLISSPGLFCGRQKGFHGEWRWGRKQSFIAITTAPPDSCSHGAARVPSFPCISLIVFSSFRLLLSHGFSAFFDSPPPLSELCVAEEVCQCKGKATASELGWLQSWGRRGWCVLCMASYTAAENHTDIHTDTYQLCDHICVHKEEIKQSDLQACIST